MHSSASHRFPWVIIPLLFVSACNEHREAPSDRFALGDTFGEGGARGDDAISNAGGAVGKAATTEDTPPNTAPPCEGTLCQELPPCGERPESPPCDCPPGFVLEDEHCVNVDECQEELHSCDAHASCQDTPGSYICTCEPGRYGDGSFCKLDSDCASTPCGNGQCSETPSGFSCACPLGTSGGQCETPCPMDEGIHFESDVLEEAVRASTAIVGPITPRSLMGKTSLSAPPPDHSFSTDDEITSLKGLSCWPTLESIRLAGHTVEDISALRHLGALKELDLRCAQPDDLMALADLNQLERLLLSKEGLCRDTFRTNVSLEFARELTTLRHLEANAFGYVSDLSPLENLVELRRLELRGSRTTDLSPLSSLRQITHLNLNQNPIASLAPLENITQLRELSVAQAALSEPISLGSLHELRHLDLSFNEITALTALVELPFLSTVDLRNNALNCDASQSQLMSWSDRGIQVHSDCDEEQP